MRSDAGMQIQPCHVISTDCCRHSSKMHHLAKSVNKHYNLSVDNLSGRQLCDQIYTNAFPSSARNLQWLKQTTWFLIELLLFL